MAMDLARVMWIMTVLYLVQSEKKIYVTVFTQNRQGETEDMYLYIASSRSHDTQVEVLAPSLPDHPVPYTNFTLSPGQREKVTLPHTIQMAPGTLTSNHVVSVVADDDVTVLALNDEKSNGDIYQVSDAGKLGKEYIVVTPEPVSENSAATVGIVSPYVNANVKVVLTESVAQISAEIDGVQQILPREFTLSLKENEAFQLQSPSDLSGTYIKSDLPIYVISGVNRTTDTDNSVCEDGQISQLRSLDKLGTQYIVFGLPVSKVQDFVHVVSTKANTNVTFQGSVTTIDQAKDIARFKIDRNQFSLLETTSPASVSVSTASGTPNTQGDVSFYNLHPLPFSGYFYTVAIPDDVTIDQSEKYLVLMVETEGVEDVLLDDVPVSGVEWKQVPGNNISACYYPLSDINGTLTVRHRKGKALMVYLQVFKYCSSYSTVMEPHQHDYLQICKGTEKFWTMSMQYGVRKLSRRMKMIAVTDENQCVMLCLRYEECIGINFSLTGQLGQHNCQLVFTQILGEEDTESWTFHQITHV